MNRASIECHLTFDCELAKGERPPRFGDVLATRGKRGTGTLYLILAARRIRRRKPSPLPRFDLRCQRIPARDSAGLKPRWWMFWYLRSRAAVGKNSVPGKPDRGYRADPKKGVAKTGFDPPLVSCSIKGNVKENIAPAS